METNQHMAAVRKICKNYLPREVQDSGWETTVGGTLAMQLQHMHPFYRCNEFCYKISYLLGKYNVSI